MVDKNVNGMALVRKQFGQDEDLLREMLQAFAEALMSREANAACGAEYGERSGERLNQRNGYRTRPWDTRVGSIELAIPKLWEGSFFEPARGPSRCHPSRR